MLPCEDVRMQKVVLWKPYWPSLHDLHDYVPWMADCHNTCHILLNSWEFHNQIASHEGCIPFHAVKCCDLTLFLTTLQTRSTSCAKFQLYQSKVNCDITVCLTWQQSLLYIQVTIPFLIGWKRTVNVRNKRAGRHLAADHTIIMLRKLKATGNHVMYDHLVQLGVTDNIP